MDIQGIYQHYKGKNYEVCGEAVNGKDGTRFILYRQLYDALSFWIRPKDMFFESIQTPQGLMSRFAKMLDVSDVNQENINIFDVPITHSESLKKYKVIDFNKQDNMYTVDEVLQS